MQSITESLKLNFTTESAFECAWQVKEAFEKAGIFTRQKMRENGTVSIKVPQLDPSVKVVLDIATFKHCLSEKFTGYSIQMKLLRNKDGERVEEKSFVLKNIPNAGAMNLLIQGEKIDHTRFVAKDVATRFSAQSN